MNSATLPNPIRDYVHDFVMRRRRFALIRSGGWAIALAVGGMLVACLLDRWMQLPPLFRLFLFLIDVGVFLAILFAPLRQVLRTRVDWLAAAAAIEQVQPKHQGRLQTVVSQLLDRHEYRGSQQMLDRLLDEVVDASRRDDRRSWNAWRGAARPWLAVGLLVAAIAILRFPPSLGLPLLIERFVRPLAALPPVTTTRISVEPRVARLLRGEELIIRARVQNAGDGPVEIFTSQAGSPWSRIAMRPAGPEEYLFRLASLQRDVRYYIAAGDARTDVYAAAVLSPPAVAEFRLRYEYPGYTERGSLTITNTDGVVEVLAGTKVTLSIVATEPLRSAVLSIGEQKLSMTSTADASVYQTEFVVTKSQVVSLDLVSQAGLASTIPNGLTINAEFDREPAVRMLQPSSDLRLQARGVLPMEYEALDDYGVTGLFLSVQAGASPVRQLPIRREGDPRRQAGRLTLDLATLNLRPGDVVTLSVVAQDGTGRTAHSDARHILIALRSVDMKTYRRIARLTDAADLATAARQELEWAAEALGRIRGTEGSEGPAANRVKIGRDLANALERSLLLHQSILRVCPDSADAQQAIALAECVDRTRQLAWSCEQLADQDTAAVAPEALTGPLNSSITAARSLETRLRTLADGERAAAILADRANLQAPTSQPADRDAADRLGETLRTARQALDAALRLLDLRPDGADVDLLLQQKVEAANQLIREARPIDFAGPAQEWAQAIQQGDATPPPLPERLLSAAAAEALRIDADPLRARGLQLGGRAASRLAQLFSPDARVGEDPVRQALHEYPAALAAAIRPHDSNRRATSQPDGADTDARQKGAEEAREKLAHWAAQARELPTTPEDLAMQASAEAARHRYSTAQDLDERLAAQEPADPDVAVAATQLRRTVSTMQDIDRASAQQSQIGQRTSSASNAQPDPQLARQQEAVTERIGQIDSAQSWMAQASRAEPEARRTAAAAIQQAQEELAHVPQQMTEARTVAESFRQARLSAERSRQDAARAAPDGKAAAQRAANEAQRAADAAARQLAAVSEAISPDSAERMAEALRSAEPEFEAAGRVAAERLRPAFQAMERALTSGDKSEIDGASAEMRSAIELMQNLLAEAQARLIELDPLVAARWFAQEASAALTQTPPDYSKALSRQQFTTLALGQAWEAALHESAAQRLAMTAGFRGLLLPDQSQPEASGASSQVLPLLRQWGFLRPRRPETISAPLREADSPAYQESIRLYFETLGKSRLDRKEDAP